MTVHLTPRADRDPLAEAHARLTEIQELLAAAAEIGAIEDTPPGLRFEYLWQARAAAKALEWALSRAAGEAERQCEAAARARGLECCLICSQWLPKEQIVRRSTGGSEA